MFDPVESIRWLAWRYPVEAMLVCLLLLYVIMMVVGFGRNKTVVTAFADAFLNGEESLYGKQWHVNGTLGSEAAVQWREKRSQWVFYASGRRFCGGMLTTLDLVPRQDLLTGVLWQLWSSSKDAVRLEVFMNEAAMPGLTIAVASRRYMVNMSKELDDVRELAKQVAVSKDKLPGWPTEGAANLQVFADQAATFYDLFTEPRVAQVMCGGRASGMQYFRSLHFSTDMKEPNPRKLVFEFVLPPPDRLQELAPLMNLVYLFIDIIGSYKPSVEAKARADKLRRERAERQYASQADKRQEALAAKREKKAQEEKERLARMDPLARARYLEQQQKRQMKKQLNKQVKMVKM